MKRKLYQVDSGKLINKDFSDKLKAICRCSDQENVEAQNQIKFLFQILLTNHTVLHYLQC